MKQRKSRIAVYIAAAFLAGAISCGMVLTLVLVGFGGGTVMVDRDTYEYYKDLDDRFSKVNSVYETVIEDYYIEPDLTALEDGMCKGLIEGLDDPYSAYMTEEEYKNWEESVTGEFEGIGIVFSTDEDGNYVIISVMEGAPAEKAGLQAGDFLIAADGESYDTMDELSAAIKGKAGTKVTITYERGGKQYDVDITRAAVEEVSVSGEILDGNIGYIAISSFSTNTAEDFEAQLKEMEEQEVDGLIIDIRDNGGGLVTSCCDIADSLMGEGVIVSMEERDGEESVMRSDAEMTDLPYVILVNENSASASEILAGAVKDNTDNPVVGVTTFGKGIVQTSGQMDDGSAIELTTMQYFSPSGEKIHGIGVKPDYVVENTGSGDAQLDKAIELLK